MRLLHKLVVVLIVAFAIPGLLFGAFGSWSMHRVAERAADEGERYAIGAETARLHLGVEREADEIGATLTAVQADVEELAAHFADTRDGGTVRDPGFYSPSEDGGIGGWGKVDPVYGVWADLDRRGDGSPWMPRPDVRRYTTDPAFRARVHGFLGRVVSLTPAFRRMKVRHGELLDLVWLVTDTGLSNAWPPYDFRKVMAEHPEVVDLDETQQDYYREATPEHDPSRGAVWIEPYLDPFRSAWMTSCVMPLYDGDTFVGVVGMDLLLTTLTSAALETPVHPDGYSMLLSRQGRPIAIPPAAIDDFFSGSDAQLLRAAFAGSGPSPASLPQDLGGVHLGGSPELETMAGRVSSGGDGTQLVKLGGGERMLTYEPIHPTGWSFVGVVPAASLAAPAASISDAIRSGSRTLIAEFAAVGVVAVLGTTLLAILLHRQAIRPLETLVRTMGEVRWDRLETPRRVTDRPDEVGALQRAFEQMLGMLRASRDANVARAETLARTNEALAREVEVRRQAQEALGDEKERLRATLLGIGDAVVALDAAARVVLLNPVACRLLDLAESTALGRPLAGLVPALAGRDLVDGVHAATEERIQLTADDGATRTLSIVSSTVFDAAGQPHGAVVVMRDMTVRMRLDEEAARISRLESVAALAAGIAHDFNNLLAAVEGNVSLLEEQLPPQSPLRRRTTAAVSALRRAADLTRQLLTFAKGGEPIRTALSLPALLRETVEFVVRGSAVAVSLDTAPDLWPVSADAGQLSRVFQNLVLNAVQAMPEGGALRVKAHNTGVGPEDGIPVVPGRYVEVDVEDTGPGIAPEVLPRIFDLFYTTKWSGSGLGLAVCFTILRRHGGHIVAESVPGAGARFRLWLPVSEVAPAAPSASLDGAKGRALDVLVMDDEPAVREVLVGLVEAAGHSAAGTRDGVELLDVVGRGLVVGRRPDVVIVDLTVRGGMGGLEVLPRLRALLPDVVVVVTSGYASDPVLSAPERYGFTSGLPKPVKFADLRTLLDGIGQTRDPGAVVS